MKKNFKIAIPKVESKVEKKTVFTPNQEQHEDLLEAVKGSEEVKVETAPEEPKKTKKEPKEKKPKRPTTITTVEVYNDMWADAKVYCFKAKMKTRDFVCTAVEEYLKNHPL